MNAEKGATGRCIEREKVYADEERWREIKEKERGVQRIGRHGDTLSKDRPYQFRNPIERFLIQQVSKIEDSIVVSRAEALEERRL